MIDFIIWVFLVAAWCWGFMNAFQEGQIFGGPGKIIRKTFHEYLQKPTIGCPKCMPSIHGTIWYFLCVNQGFLLWILFIVAVSGINTVIVNALAEDEEDD